MEFESLKVLCPPPLFFRKLTSIPAGVSQYVTNENCLVCLESEKYAFGVTPRSLGSTWHSPQPGRINLKFIESKNFANQSGWV